MIEIEFKPNIFGDYDTVELGGRSLCFRVKGAPRRPFIFTDSNHRVTVSLMRERFKSVGR